MGVCENRADAGIHGCKNKPCCTLEFQESITHFLLYMSKLKVIT